MNNMMAMMRVEKFGDGASTNVFTQTDQRFELDADVLPEGADDLLPVIYKVRRLRGDGTYTDWEYAAGGYSGADAIYNPSAGGIYQVQALASPGWGAADERYYRWAVSEPRKIGRRKIGEPSRLLWGRILSGEAYTNYLDQVEAGMWGENPPR